MSSVIKISTMHTANRTSVHITVFFVYEFVLDVNCIWKIWSRDTYINTNDGVLCYPPLKNHSWLFYIQSLIHTLLLTVDRWVFFYSSHRFQFSVPQLYILHDPRTNLSYMSYEHIIKKSHSSLMYNVLESISQNYLIFDIILTYSILTHMCPDKSKQKYTTKFECIQNI